MSQDSPLELATDREGVTLRELATPRDDQAYFASVEASRPELDRYEGIGGKYQTLADVTHARLSADPSRTRLGIWDGDTFVGTINATPDEQGGVEIGYWLDSRHTGQGYATLATRALTRYLTQRFSPVYAEVAEGNDASVAVLERVGFRRGLRTPHRAGYIALELAIGL